MSDDYAYRFEYADKSAFVIYPNGAAFVTFPDGRPAEKKFGKIDNRIPLLIGQAAKPRQDEIERLRLELVKKTAALQEIGRQRLIAELADEFGEDDGGDYEGAYEAIIKIARDALAGG